MKTKIVLLVLLMSLAAFSQQKADSLHSQIFSLSPVSKKVDKVNGMALGIGHMWNHEGQEVTVNGLNLEINPLMPFVILFFDPDKAINDSIVLRHNGLHLSTGGFTGGVAQNGLGVSVYNVCYSSNGLSVTGLYNVSVTMNGLHIAGITNKADAAAGLLLAPVNNVADFTGLQLGLYNKTETFKGIQIGLFNRTEKARGLQIGLWNINGKRSLPFINF
jgi:hypothetical protein